MQLQDIADHLQITKVVWIDDLFSKNKENLKTLLICNLGLIAEIDEPFFKGIVVADEFKNASEFPDSFETYLISTLDNINDEQAKIIFGNLTQALSLQDPQHKDMNGATIDFLTASLNAIEVCRKSFTEAFDEFDAIFSQDEGTIYLIDKDNKYDVHPVFSDGIEVIKKIVNSNSKGIPVLFSHNFQPQEESAKEIELFKEITPNSSQSIIPLTVVSKNQFNDQATREERLKAALKRITVRYTIGKMATSLKEEVDKGFANAISKLNGVPTAQLDKYLIKSATEEGISEAHVLERIISAEMKTSIKNRLADDDSQQKLQMLRKIKLETTADEATPELISFFESEVYESENLLNKTFSPIACGDIFEEINETAAEKQRFILIAPPCDTALRGGDGSNLGKRNGSVGFIAAIKPVNP